MKRKMSVVILGGMLLVLLLVGCKGGGASSASATGGASGQSSANASGSREGSAGASASKVDSTEEVASEAASAEASTSKGSSPFDISKRITVVSREDGSGTRGAFIQLFHVEEKGANGKKVDRTTTEAVIANKTDIVMSNVMQDKYAVGYLSLGSLNDKVKAVKIDNVPATAENVLNKSYGITRPFLIAVKGTPSLEAQDFIDFILSKEGQEVVAKSYIPVVNDAKAFEGTKPQGKIVVAGSSSVTPVMEKLKEAYEKRNPALKVEIQMSDSTSGMVAVANGTAQIGMASRDLKDSEKENLTSLEIAQDGIAVIVNKENPIENLTQDQVKAIYTGEISAWEGLQK